MLASMANQRASSSSASFPKSREDQVFLSFRGEDTRHNFTDHLYNALCQRGINTFRDDELRRGEEISSALLTAIEESKISVVVFSENYASSKWCLDELVKILDCKESNQQLVIPVFYKVNPSDVRNHRGSFGDALANMERKYKDEMDKVKKWRAALSQAAALSGFPLDEHQSESKFIQNIIEEISKHVVNLVCLEVAEHPVGMQAQVQVMNKLLDLGENDVLMVGVWGTGGIGKTTIAKAVYNSIAHKFEGCCFLANVRECSMSHGGLAKLQKTLLSEILRGKKLKVTNVDKGVTMIKEWLRRRKVLLVLDDVDDMEQLHKLVGACDWFGAGSRIIITTRDKQLLTAHHHVNSIYEVKILDNHKALELFCWYAFKRSEPPLGDYVKLAERAIRYAQGLPLALKVLGSCLCGGDIDKWKAALEGFKSPKIQDVLKISYNALDDIVKEVFLDIACFFKGKSRNYVIEACELNTRYGIDVLIEKALISVEGSYIQTHDLLEKMGKDIIEEESRTELGERSRLWFHEDVKHVLTNNTGTNKITGIVLNFPKQDDEIFLDVGTSFSKMKNLKILINYNICLSGDPSSIPNNLRVLEWHGRPFQSFPANFLQKALFVLNPFRRRIKQLGEGLKHLTKLTSLNFKGSKFVTEIPDLSNSPNLRYLNAYNCTSLVEVHPSVGYLDKLVVLDFRFCRELTKFPNKVWLKSLNFFGLCDCIKLESFPEIVDKMKSLDKLDLGRTAIKELPASIGNLIGLEKLDLSKSAIKELPSSIGNLTALRKLDLQGCESLANLPQSIYGLQNLMFLNLNRCLKLVTLPNNLISEDLSSAESLPLEVQTNANSPHHDWWMMFFEECNLSNIDSLENFCRWSNLTEINLSKSNFVSLPVCISKCVSLLFLDLRGCKRLVEILVQLPVSIQEIHMADCISLERFSKILEDGDMHHIHKIDLSNCHKLRLDVSKMTKIVLNQMSRSEGIIVKLPGSKVPEWFTFRNYFDDYDESKFDFFVHGMGAHYYELPIEIPPTSVLENTKLVLCAVWEITESFVSPCSVQFSLAIYFEGMWGVSEGKAWMKFFPLHDHHKPPISGVTAVGKRLSIKSILDHMSRISMSRDGDDNGKHIDEKHMDDDFCLDTLTVFGGETGACNVWLECSPLSFPHTTLSRSFRVTVVGKGLRIKSIGAHLAPISMSSDGDGDDDGKHIDENELDDDGTVGDEVRSIKRTKI